MLAQVTAHGAPPRQVPAAAPTGSWHALTILAIEVALGDITRE